MHINNEDAKIEISLCLTNYQDEIPRCKPRCSQCGDGFCVPSEWPHEEAAAKIRLPQLAPLKSCKLEDRKQIFIFQQMQQKGSKGGSGGSGAGGNGGWGNGGNGGFGNGGAGTGGAGLLGAGGAGNGGARFMNEAGSGDSNSRMYSLNSQQGLDANM